jgi:hypothetical protein
MKPATLRPLLSWSKCEKGTSIIARGAFFHVIIFSGYAYYLSSKLDEGKEKLSGPHMTELKAKKHAELIESNFKQRKIGAI